MSDSEKVLESLLESQKLIAEIKTSQDRILQDLDTVKKESSEHNTKLAVLENSLKNLGDVLDGERKLNRDRQLDFSKTLDDKVGGIYKMVTVIATVISVLMSLLGYMVKVGG